MALMDQRSDFGCRVERMADFDSPDTLAGAGSELFGDRRLNQQARKGRATLAVERVNYPLHVNHFSINPAITRVSIPSSKVQPEGRNAAQCGAQFVVLSTAAMGPSRSSGNLTSTT